MAERKPVEGMHLMDPWSEMAAARRARELAYNQPLAVRERLAERYYAAARRLDAHRADLAAAVEPPA